jgi:hypothetical protein
LVQAIFSDKLREAIQALDDSTFLLTVAWEEGAGAGTRKIARVVTDWLAPSRQRATPGP